MKAFIVAVGSEMLTPFRVDTNSLAITERLNAHGYDVRLKAVVGDDQAELADVITSALGWADLIVCTGGLGPTEDDVTRDAVARVLGLPLEIDEPVLQRIRDRFARRGIEMPEINRRQAMVPKGAILIDNLNGTAPGLLIERGRTVIALLPGPPREMTPMMERVIHDRLAPLSGGAALFRRVLRCTGRSESDIDARAQPVYSRWLSHAIPVSTTILAVSGQIELHLTARARSLIEAGPILDQAVGELQAVLGEVVYSVDGRTLEEVVGDLLRARGLTVAVAESCTGGLLASRLTDVPGSSDYVVGGAVCYSNRAKAILLDVPESILEEHGAVSEPVARAMADGVRSRLAAHVGIGITGVAGPGGGSPEKPVGTVAIAVATDDEARVRTFRFVGARGLVRFQAATAALNMLRLMLLNASSPSETERA